MTIHGPHTFEVTLDENGVIVPLGLVAIVQGSHTVSGTYTPNGFCAPLSNVFDIETGMPHMPNITCAGGHRCSGEFTEYIDGEIVSQCENCGERVILPRVPGGIPYLRLKAFVGGLMGLDLGNADDNFDLTEILAMFGDLREALDEEEQSVQRSLELFEIAEAILRRKLAEANA